MALAIGLDEESQPQGSVFRGYVFINMLVAFGDDQPVRRLCFQRYLWIGHLNLIVGPIAGLQAVIENNGGLRKMNDAVVAVVLHTGFVSNMNVERDFSRIGYQKLPAAVLRKGWIDIPQVQGGDALEDHVIPRGLHQLAKSAG